MSEQNQCPYLNQKVGESVLHQTWKLLVWALGRWKTGQYAKVGPPAKVGLKPEVSRLVDLAGAKKGSAVSTAPTGGGFTGVTLTSWKEGSGRLKDLESNIASNLLYLSNHLRSIASSLLSVDTLEDPAGEECCFFLVCFLMSGVFWFFLAFATLGVLLATSELLSIFLTFATTGVLLISSELLTPSFTTPRTKNKSRVHYSSVLYSSAWDFCSCFSFFFWYAGVASLAF